MKFQCFIVYNRFNLFLCCVPLHPSRVRTVKLACYCLFSAVFVGALTDILDAFVISENAAKMRMARESAGNDMLKVMQTVFPITVQIQMDVIKKYGFTADGDGR